MGLVHSVQPSVIFTIHWFLFHCWSIYFLGYFQNQGDYSVVNGDFLGEVASRSDWLPLHWCLIIGRKASGPGPIPSRQYVCCDWGCINQEVQFIYLQ